MSPILAKVQPKITFWLSLLGIAPLLGGFLAYALKHLAVLEHLADIENSMDRLVLQTGLMATICIALAGLWNGYFYLYFVLKPNILILGRHFAQVEVPFEEIESIVLGLSYRLPGWLDWVTRLGLALLGYDPAAANQNNSQSFVVRLSGNRYLPMDLAPLALTQKKRFQAEFLHFNQHLIVGPETYSDREERFLTFARPNRINVML
jgi:hypothetical protein